MKLTTAQEARELVEMGKEWRKGNLIDILDRTMSDIKGASLAGKTAITIESVAPTVSLSAFETELIGLGYEVKVLREPWPPRCLKISWKE